MADNRLDELRRRLEKDPGSRLFAQLAEQLRKEGELEEAIGVARAGLQQHPNYPSARLTLGRALLDSGDATAARGELEAAVKGAPDNILASRLLGEALEELGELAAALKQLQATLLMAPGDPQIQSRIEAIQQELGKPAGAPSPPAEPEGRDHTKPMQALKLEEPPAPGEPPAQPVRPPAAQAPADEEEEEGLPPTIRIRMPGDPIPSGRAPMPPIPGGPGPAPKGTTSEPAPAAAPEPQPEPEPAAGLGAAEFSAPPRAPRSGGVESDQAPTLPSSKAAEYAGAEGQPPDSAPEAPGSALKKAGDPAAAAPPVPPTGITGGDVGAAETSFGDLLPPTVPPGLVTAPAGLDARSPRAPGSTGEAGAAPNEPPPEGGSLDFVAGDAAAAFTTAPGGDVTTPPVQPGLEDTTTPPVTPPGAEETGVPGRAEAAVPAVPRAAAPGGGGDEAGQPLASATLAELYLQQGLLERAVEVYGEVVEAEPANQAARARLAELEASLRTSGSAPLPSSPHGDDPRAARRRALERTIERLEALLAIVQRR